MNKTNIKNFAVWAREKLIMDIKDRARLLGITDKGIADALPQSTSDLKFFDIGTREYAEVVGKEIRQREALVKAIRDKEQDSNKYKEAFDFIVEEVAYTWFNRLIAIRFMEVNNYLPSGIRVLSSENSNKLEPDFITSPFDTDMDFTPYEQDKIVQYKDDNKLDELFKMLFIKQCNKLNEILPELFEKTDDYSELLLSISFKDSDGIVYHLVHDIDEDDFNVEKSGQVEIIGWLYQYYISVKHDYVIDPLHGKTIKKDDIPAATQIFTTDWVVRYMVDNSLGRYWIERNPESNLADKLEYFVKPKDGHINYVDERVEPIDMTFFDPCMGSGHILVYAFDVLMEIYRERGYTDRDAAQSIVEHNLYGLDIDKRAYQLAYFAVMMKARYYNRRIFRNCINNNLTYIDESNSIESFACDSLTDNSDMNKIGEYLVKTFKYAKEYGSLISVNNYDYISFEKYLNYIEGSSDRVDIFNADWIKNVLPLIRQLSVQAQIMSKKYVAVVTNPPYMNRFEGHLKDFIQNYFAEYKGDLFSAFMYKNFGYCIKDGYTAFMTPNVWMFIKTYQKLREYILNNKSIITLVMMAKGAFFKEATVDICSFVLSNRNNEKKGLYFQLEDFPGGMEIQKKKILEAINNTDCNYFYETDILEYNRISGYPIAFWASEGMKEAFEKYPTIFELAPPKQGLATADNDRFLRIWYEVNYHNIGFSCANKNVALLSCKKWFPYNKGGAFKRWYGNRDYVVNWENDGYEIKNFKDSNGKLRSRPQNTQYYFKESITWSDITSSSFSGRYSDPGFIFDIKGSSGFPEHEYLKYILGFLNSKISQECIKILNPTITTQVGDMARIPVAFHKNSIKVVDDLVSDNICIAKQDWDFFETSWDFRKDAFVDIRFTNLALEKYVSMRDVYNIIKRNKETLFLQMHNNENRLNEIFVRMYGLENEIDTAVSIKDITVSRIFDTPDDVPIEMRKSKFVLTKHDVVTNFVSYAVGCLFGRYSLDKDGLVYAGGKWNNTMYNSFIPDNDNCIPITDEDYFEDDIVGRFIYFVKVVFGNLFLEDNLSFIANALGNKGKTSREVIRNYFLNDFIKDHIKKYQKRPIYWLFDSGKQNGFKALVYMHRWNADTVGNMRVEYLHKMQLIYEREIPRMQDIIDSCKDSREIAAAEKRKEKLQKQYKEIKDYDAKVAHIALSRIDIDLDDGVKVNYEKVQTAQDGKHLQILTKI